MTEDTFTTPESWRRSILPRRGGLPVTYRPGAGWRDAVARSLAEHGDPRDALTHPATPADIRDAGVAYLDAQQATGAGGAGAGGAGAGGAGGVGAGAGGVGAGGAGVTPLGAAAVTITTVGPSQSWSSAVSSPHADGWIAAQGLAFAVRAAVELVELRVETPYRSDLGPRAVCRYGDFQAWLEYDTDGTTLLLQRLRVAMAAATDDEHAAAVEALAELREGPLTLRQRATTSFLAPTMSDWVAADVELVSADRGSDWSALQLYASITDPAQFHPLETRHSVWHLVRFTQRLHTLAEGLGAAGLPVFRTLLDGRTGWTDGVRAVLDLVAAVPTDEAFQLLLEHPDERTATPFLIEAADRFPRRALRILATADRSGAVGALLQAHTSRHRALAESVAADLPAAAAERIATVTARLDAFRAAPPEALPPVLADPPWLRATKTSKPAVVAGLTCADETVLRWEPGERARWQQLQRQGGGSLDAAEMQEVAGQLRAGHGDPYRQLSFFVDAPDALARPLVADWRPANLWDAGSWLRILVGRFEMDAWPLVLHAAGRAPVEAAPALMAFAGPEAAVLMAEWFSRMKTLRPTALQWLHRHPEAAARALVPPALGKAGPARRHADAALLAIAAAGHRDLITSAARELGEAAARGHGEAAARGHGEAVARVHGGAARGHGEGVGSGHGEAAAHVEGEAVARVHGGAARGHGEGVGGEHGEAAVRERGEAAVAAVVRLLDADPLLQLPAKVPVGPDWADPAQLAPVELSSGAGALPAAAAGHLLTILAMSKLAEPYAGLDPVVRACTPKSLAEFGWSLFEQWRLVGTPAKDGWVLDALAFLGDDDTVRRLAPVIRAWPGEGGHSKAVIGLDVLAAIGTDVALMHLHGISEKVKFKGLKDRAKEKIAEVAAALELTPEQLADRLVPSFGLDADGTLTIDYGPRRFTVGFDEQLKPFVADENGARRKDLPKPGSKDDPELAPAAAARFAALKKDVRAVAADQLRRFEQAMVTGRRWSGAEFQQLIVEHPLVWHVARRLVWATFDPAEDTAPTTATAARTAAAGSATAGTVTAGTAAAGIAAAAGSAAARTATAGSATAGMPPSTMRPSQGAGLATAARAGTTGAGIPRGAMRAVEDAADDASARTAGVGMPRGTMRLAEDRTLADVDDVVVTLADDAVVGVAHPLHLAGALAAWGEVFADYEILQPFPQLSRDTYALTGAERAATDLTRFHGVKVPTTKVLGLERRGWRRAAAEDAGVQPAMERALPGGGLLVAELDPGIAVGDVSALSEQALLEVWILGPGRFRWTRDRPHTFGELDPVTVSEIIRDLREVMQ